MLFDKYCCFLSLLKQDRFSTCFKTYGTGSLTHGGWRWVQIAFDTTTTLPLHKALKQSDMRIKCDNKNQQSVLIFNIRELSVNRKD